MSGTPTPRELRETSNLTAGPWTARRSLGLARRESEEFARLLQKSFPSRDESPVRGSNQVTVGAAGRLWAT